MIETISRNSKSAYSIAGRRLVIYGSDDLYYRNIIDFLKNKTLNVSCYSNDIAKVLDEIIASNPLYAIISLEERNEFEITDFIRITREYSPVTHIIIQIAINNLTK